MFNLIVSSGLRNKRRGSIWAQRTFGYTTDDLVERFKPNGNLDVGGVKQFPALLMEEGTDGEIAGVGWLTRVEQRERDINFEFRLDPDVPRLTNADVVRMAGDLRIEDFELQTNHWAIKDVDLFRVLHRHSVGQRAQPTVFPLSNNPTRPNLISFMMPFSLQFTAVYQDIKAVLEAKGYQCQRADDMWVHEHIMSDIIELICTSAVVVCDLSGKNPNVFYEAGIAHTLGKDVILITQSNDDVPFDLRSIRYLPYLNNGEGRARLSGEVLARVQSITM